jgi:hypothetical protein
VCGDVRATVVADMIDEDSDWISLEAAVTYVEVMLQCYRENARELVRKAVKSTKVRSRTLHSSPKWLVSVIAGQEVFHSDHGESIEVCRKDLLELFPKRQNDVTQRASRESGSGQKRFRRIADPLDAAFKELWPDNEIPRDATVRDNKIHSLLISRGIIAKGQSVKRTIQRFLKNNEKVKSRPHP